MVAAAYWKNKSATPTDKINKDEQPQNQQKEPAELEDEIEWMF